MIYLELFISYLKIGFFGFGGGYSMLSLIHNEVVVQHEWITNAALSDIVAISQMTPGPIAINSATYIGYTVAGFWGAVVATIAVCLPSLTIMALITRFFLKLQNNKYVESIMTAMKPVVLAMIASASMMLIFPASSDGASMIDSWSWVLFLFALIASLRKVNPIHLIVLSAVAGIGIYYVPTLFDKSEVTDTPKSEVAVASTAKQSDPLEAVWGDLNLADTTLIGGPKLEQHWANYLYILQVAPQKVVEKSISSIFDKASESPASLINLFELGEKYLYDPNSPMHNDELFIPMLEYMVATPKIDPIDKIRAEALLKIASRNRPNSEAADFEYTTIDGSHSTMHAIEAEHTILYFNNPDCEECARTKSIIEESELLNTLTQAHKLAILSIYPDEDVEIWRKAEYPLNVINSYDKKRQTSKLYDLKAIPTLYLLDEEKRVILKDAPLESIIKYLEKI